MLLGTAPTTEKGGSIAVFENQTHRLVDATWRRGQKGWGLRQLPLTRHSAMGRKAMMEYVPGLPITEYKPSYKYSTDGSLSSRFGI